MANRNEIHVIAHLFAGGGGLQELKRYEIKVLKIVEQHRGELLLSFNPLAGSAETPDEIHYLKFPNASAFEEFKNDARYKELAKERAEAISRTEIYVSGRVVYYPD